MPYTYAACADDGCIAWPICMHVCWHRQAGFEVPLLYMQVADSTMRITTATIMLLVLSSLLLAGAARDLREEAGTTAA